VNIFGGFKRQGQDIEAARQMIDDALLLQDAGAFGLILECVPDGLAKVITERLDIPTIGIGAGVHCDGQVLVIQDLLGMFRQMRPKFVKTYTQMGDSVLSAVKQYIHEVQNGEFPTQDHSFPIDERVLAKL
jgi:3-methyl-2-oxobutanoate hydroxymethyltransferase